MFLKSQLKNQMNWIKNEMILGGYFNFFFYSYMYVETPSHTMQ